MARGKKTGGRPFPKGNKLSPGRPRLPPEIKEGRKLNQAELERVINKLVYLEKSELNHVIKEPSTPVIELIAAQILLKASEQGDHTRLDFILTRMLGRVKEKMELSAHVIAGPQVVLTLPANGRTKEEVEILALEAELG